jgi:hypothetical protein
MAASKNPRLRLLHMRDEIESLSNELAGQGFEIYRQSYGLRGITERAIQIVSEAARALPEELRHVIPTRRGPTSSLSAIRYGTNTSPPHDVNGMTAHLAAYVAFETLLLLEQRPARA